MENPGFSQQFKLVCKSANFWLIFIIPLAISGLIIWLSLDYIYPYNRPELYVKNALEEVSLHITSGFCFICLMRFIYGKDKFFLWASGVMMILFIREIHIPISSAGVYIGLLWLFYIAYKKPHIFGDYLGSKYFVTLLGIGFFTYALSVTIDERVWRFVPGEFIFHTKLEETMEMLGHIFVGCALLFAKKKPQEKSAIENVVS
jgi:hypothetical protein